MDEQQTTIGGRLREERMRLEIRQAALAEKGGVSKTTQVHYESGARFPDLGYLQLIAEAGVDIDYVIFGMHKALRGAALINWKLHDQLLSEIEAWASKLNYKVPFTRKMELLRVLYVQFAATGHIDPYAFQTVMSLSSDVA